MFTRLLQFIRHVLTRPKTSRVKLPNGELDSPVKFSFDGDPIHIEFDGMVLTFGTIEMLEAPDDDIYAPIVGRMTDDGDTPARKYYRDEDGELRPLRDDREALVGMPLEELAGEFLRAKADAEAMPDRLEREIVGVLRDAYGFELWRRAAADGTLRVQVSGRQYEIVPLPISGCVQMLMIE